MNFFEKIKRIFIKDKVKALPSESTDISKIVLLATRERDPENVLDILHNHAYAMKSSDIVQIIGHMPMKSRMSAIIVSNKYITPYDLAEFALKKLDYLGKIDVLEKFQYRLDLEDIYQLFNSLPPDQRLNALRKCSDRFDSFGIAEVIKNYVPLYERLDALNIYRLKLDGFSKATIIRKLDGEGKVKALELYAKEINQNDLEDIVCETESDKMPDVLNMAYHYLSCNQIADIIKYNIPITRKLEMLYKCCYKLDSATISDLIKFSIPEESREEALIALQNRMDKTNVGEVLQFCTKSLKVLKKVQHNLYPEDVEYFKNSIK
ncbi:MAG: hypothetical protein ACI4VN_06520 [Clostridia bacterium]